MMDAVTAVNALTSIAMGICIFHCAPSPTPPRPVGGGAQTATNVVERISAARCDVSQSCNRVGPGATYRDRDDCMSRTRVQVAGQLDASRCQGAIGETGVSRCLDSLQLSECDQPGQLHAEHPRHNALGVQCDPDAMCVE